MRRDITPTLTFITTDQPTVQIHGAWLTDMLAEASLMQTIHLSLQELQGKLELAWDLTQLTALDHIGAQLLWQAWGKSYPAKLQLREQHQALFERLAEVQRIAMPVAQKPIVPPFGKLGRLSLNFALHVIGVTELLGQLVLDLARLVRHPTRGPWKEISANIYRTGFQAMAITALVGLLIGVVLSYLSGQQLRSYGGDLFIVNLLGISIIRELGPMLAAILIAGRSGSAITAQLGVMKVTEELDAMRVMGIPVGFRLIMPKVIALAITMPLIVIWTDVMALIGGAISAQFILDMSPGFFLHKLPDVVSLANYWIGLGKGVVFGILIAVIACHYGLRIKPNTESLGLGTTSSVVVSITSVIIADAFFAVLFRNIAY
ncbi:MlaE family ABC transporter permease [Undibacterium flavidum]|uniref:ABC transporter permease n=1 Tax=Undibacterium flavidum TaxID=2762297 RepID=A0ABR6YC65_9BURK|nr:ABC transporter permease [Undibacterium flavidum]MBC3874152.1 ABC transporter permease [Undibacterium flavidum]